MRVVVLCVHTLMWLAVGAKDDRPNILIILADDMGYGDVSIFPGSPKSSNTPRLAAWAQDATVLHNFHAAAPVCTPTRASLMTGLFPWRFGIHHVFGGDGVIGRHFLPRVPTLPEALRSAGYYTAHVGKWHLGGLLPEDLKDRRGQRKCDHPGPNQQGFDEYTCMEEEHGSIRNEVLLRTSQLYHQGSKHLLRNDHPIAPTDEMLTARETNEAIKVLRDRAANKTAPFYLQLWFHAPHTPLEEIPPYVDQYRNVRDHGARKYYSMVTSVDDGVGHILDELKVLGLHQNTVVMFMSDNGPEDGPGSPGNFQGRKRWVHEGGIAVPFFIQWEGHIPKGKVLNDFAVSVDIVPTVLELARVPVPAHMQLDGTSMLPFLLGTGTAHTPDGRTLHSSDDRFSYWVYGHHTRHAVDNSAARRAGFKLLKLGADLQLHDMTKDSSEQHPVWTGRHLDGPMAETSDISWEIIAKISDPEYRARRDVIDFAARSLHDHLNAFLNTRKRIGPQDRTPRYDTCKVPDVHEVLPF